jgi:hypothetical protein
MDVAVMVQIFNHAPIHDPIDNKTEVDGSVMLNGINDELTLAARLLLATLFLVFGWRKLRDYSGTIS